MAFDWKTLIGPAVQAGGGLLGGRQQRKNTERTIRGNMELAKYGYGQDLEMWHRTNEYNSPQAQMERLKAAGLSPQLAYGNGTVAGNTTPASPPKYNAPRVDYSGIQPMVDPTMMLNAYQDFKLKQAQTDNVKAQTNNIETRTGIEAGVKEAIRLLELESRGHDLTMRKEWDPNKAAILQNQAEASNFLTEEARAKLANLIQQNKTMKAGQDNIEADTLYKKFRNDWMKMGFTTSDNVGFRIIAKWLSEFGIGSWGELGKYGGAIFKPNR